MTDPLPHANLYARLGPSPGRGVGVFALRDIPAGTEPFRGDAAGTVRVPAAAVAAIAEEAVRRMYRDFCPLVDGAYVAPADFNAMGIAWYMNHADRPNVACGPGLRFAAARAIAPGEELTVDYRTFSDHAETYAALWRAGPGGPASG